MLHSRSPFLEPRRRQVALLKAVTSHRTPKFPALIAAAVRRYDFRGERRQPFWKRSRHTMNNASRTMLPDIFEVP